MHPRLAALCAALIAVTAIVTLTAFAQPVPAREGSLLPAPPKVPVTTEPERNPRPVADQSAPMVVGTASNYPGTAGFAGAVVALPGALGGSFTGAQAGEVMVCADRCAVLPVVDWCQCYWGTADQRVVDLSHEAWAAISDQPLSRGLIEVRLILDRSARAAGRDASGGAVS